MKAIKVNIRGWAGLVSTVNRYGTPWSFESNKKFAIALSEWLVSRVKSYCEKASWDFDVYEHNPDWHKRLTETERVLWERDKKEAWVKVGINPYGDDSEQV